MEGMNAGLMLKVRSPMPNSRTKGLGWPAISPHSVSGFSAIRVGIRSPEPSDLLERAVAAASAADTCLVVVEALAALTALAASGLVEARAFRELYIRLTAIAKRYLERRLDAPVLEMTTAETVAFLREHAHGGDVLPVMLVKL